LQGKVLGILTITVTSTQISSCRNLGDMTLNSGAYPILLPILRINRGLSPIVSHDGIWLTIYIPNSNLLNHSI
jgi:hypothetical protein